MAVVMCEGQIPGSMQEIYGISQLMRGGSCTYTSCAHSCSCHMMFLVIPIVMLFDSHFCLIW